MQKLFRYKIRAVRATRYALRTTHYALRTTIRDALLFLR